MPIIKLKEVLKQNKRDEEVQPNKIYRILGLRSESKGPFLNTKKKGDVEN